MKPEQQLRHLNAKCGQILEAAKQHDYVHYKDRVAQSRTCILAALEECDEPIEDSEQFISDVIEEQRIIIEGLLLEVVLTDEPLPDTEEAPEIEDAPDTLRSSGIRLKA